MKSSKLRFMSSFLFEAIQSHIKVSLNAGSMCATFWSSGTLPLALSKKVWHACSNSMTSLGVNSPLVMVGG